MTLLELGYDALPPPCDNCGLRAWKGHVCPEEVSLETAEYLLQFHSSTRIPMNPIAYASCVLAYKAAGREGELWTST